MDPFKAGPYQFCFVHVVYKSTIIGLTEDISTGALEYLFFHLKTILKDTVLVQNM